MNLDASNLQISIEEQERWRRRMNVTVPASIVQAEEQKAASQLAGRARLKGFRKGRVPAKVIESRFGNALRQEALDKLVSSAYKEALATQELRPISDGELEDLQYRPEEDLTFAITFDVAPVFEIARLGGFAVERQKEPVTDEEIDALLGRIQEQNGVWRPLEEGAPEDKDLVSVKITRLDGSAEPADEARDYEIVLGSGDAIADIENAIKSLEPGGAGDFDVTFPDDFPTEERRGDTERLRIELVARRTLDVPEIDDELAKQVGDFETLDALTAKIRDDLEKEADQRADSMVRARLLDLLVEANPFDVPASMVNRYSEGVLGDTSKIPEEKLTEFREQLRPEAERAVKRILVLERVAETQSLSATEEDLDNRVQEIAAANNTDPGKVYAELQKAGRLETLERELTEKAVFDFLFKQSEITDAPTA